ncbi:hypothetical protein HKX48_000732, partial [Thoreauomyces humboldtii]
MADSGITHRHAITRQDSFASVSAPAEAAVAGPNTSRPSSLHGTPAGVIHAPTILPKDDPNKRDAAYVAFEKAGIENPDDGEYDEEDDAIARAINSVVPQTDDPTDPVVTLRSVLLGTLWGIILGILNAAFAFRTSYFGVPDTVATLISYPMGLAMARFLPTTKFSTFGYQWSLNPGPFNKKEHVIIVLIASAAGGVPYGLDNVVAQKMVANQIVTFAPAFFWVLATQMTGLGCAGVLRRFIIWPREMTWPGNFGDLSLFASFWNSDVDLVGQTKYTLGRYSFFWIVAISIFIYEWLPMYFFSTLQAISLLCWFSKSTAVKQIGNSYNGLGMLTFTLDYQYVLGAPLTTPFWVTCVTTVGSILWCYVLVPILNTTNMAGSDILGDNGEIDYNDNSIYDVTGTISLGSSNVLNPDFTVNQTFIDENGPFQITTFFYVSYIQSFFILTASLSHIWLWYGPQIIRQVRQMRAGEGRQGNDVHNTLMRAYAEVPEYCYLGFALVWVVVMIIVGHTTVFTMSWWSILLAVALNGIFLVPFGILQAITGYQMGLNVITEMIAGFLFQGQVIQVMCFKSFGYNVLIQALAMAGDLKLGHYLHIAPWIMFGTQIWGNLVGAAVSTGSSLWIIDNWGPNGSNMINPSSTQWNNIYYETFFDAGIIWGAIGPKDFFGQAYKNLTYLAFLIGAIAPVIPWLGNRYYPSRWWVYINFPLFATTMTSGGFQNSVWMTLILAFIFQFYLYRHKFAWWSKYTYTLQTGLDVGTAIAVVVTALLSSSHPGPVWRGNPNTYADYYCDETISWQAADS